MKPQATTDSANQGHIHHLSQDPGARQEMIARCDLLHQYATFLRNRYLTETLGEKYLGPDPDLTLVQLTLDAVMEITAYPNNDREVERKFSQLVAFTKQVRTTPACATALEASTNRTKAAQFCHCSDT